MNNGEVLVDGGTMNNLPVDAMRELGRGPVDRLRRRRRARVHRRCPRISTFPRSGISPAGCAASRGRPNIFRILWRAGMVNSAATSSAHREKTDLLLQPPLTQVDMLNWQHFDRAIALGYEYTTRRLAELPADATVWKHAHGRG